MKNIKFYLGLNDKDSQVQEINTIDCYKIAMNMIWSYFGGWTIEKWKWFYKHDDWTIVIEKTLIISTCTDKPYEKFIEDLKRTFNQESIMIEVLESNISFQ